MSASCQKIKLRTWPRRDIFSFFSALDQPFYSVCFRVDVTQLHTYTKTHGLSFDYVMTYLVTQAVNEVENLPQRQRFSAGQTHPELYRAEKGQRAVPDHHVSM